MRNLFLKAALGSLILLLTDPLTAGAHCDTMDGPVVKAAKLALEKGDITPVLRWVKKEYEDEVRQAFQRSLEVRKTSAKAKELADMYFFETVVRVHRAGEGEPYTGLKPAGTPIDPVIEHADKALELNDVKTLSRDLLGAIEKGVVTRFQKALHAKANAETSLEAGREYVESYVAYVHFVEQVAQLAERDAGHRHEEAHNHEQE